MMLLLRHFFFRLCKIIPNNPVSQFFNRSVNERLNQRLRKGQNRRVRENQLESEPERLTDREVLNRK